MTDQALTAAPEAEPVTEVEHATDETAEPSALMTRDPGIADAAEVDFGGGRSAWLVVRRGFAAGPEIRNRVKAALETSNRPIDGLHVIIVESLPRDEGGNLDEAAARREGWRSPWVYDWEPPKAGLESEVAAIIGELVGHDDISMTDDLVSLGGDSLLAAELVEMFDERLDRLVSASDLFAARDLRELCVLVTGDTRG